MPSRRSVLSLAAALVSLLCDAVWGTGLAFAQAPPAEEPKPATTAPEEPATTAPPAEPSPAGGIPGPATTPEEVQGAPAGAAPAEETVGAPPAGKQKFGEEIVVTGSRIRRKDLTTPAPVTVLSREQEWLIARTVGNPSRY